MDQFYFYFAPVLEYDIDPKYITKLKSMLVKHKCHYYSMAIGLNNMSIGEILSLAEDLALFRKTYSLSWKSSPTPYATGTSTVGIFSIEENFISTVTMQDGYPKHTIYPIKASMEKLS